MRHILIASSLFALATLHAPALSQPAPGAETAPTMGTSSSNYVAWAADSDMYEIQSSKLALTKGSSAEVKSFAREMIADHTRTTKSLMAALPKTNPRVPKPPKMLSAPNQAKIAQLREVPKEGFDALYMQQQADAHRMAWALHKGYATDGADPSLREVASTAVPIIEKHAQHLKTPGAGGM